MHTEYHIISENSQKAVERQVNNMIANGWQCQGGVSVALAISPGGGSYYEYAQAMVK